MSRVFVTRWRIRGRKKFGVIERPVENHCALLHHRPMVVCLQH